MSLLKAEKVTASIYDTELGAWAATAIVALKALGIVVLYLKSLTIDSLLWIFNSNKFSGNKSLSNSSCWKFKSIILAMFGLSCSTCKVKLWVPAQALFTSSHIFCIQSKRLKSSLRFSPSYLNSL